MTLTIKRHVLLSNPLSNETVLECANPLFQYGEDSNVFSVNVPQSNLIGAVSLRRHSGTATDYSNRSTLSRRIARMVFTFTFLECIIFRTNSQNLRFTTLLVLDLAN